MAILERIQKQLHAGNFTARVFVDLKNTFRKLPKYFDRKP